MGRSRSLLILMTYYSMRIWAWKWTITDYYLFFIFIEWKTESRHWTLSVSQRDAIYIVVWTTNGKLLGRIQQMKTTEQSQGVGKCQVQGLCCEWHFDSLCCRLSWWKSPYVQDIVEDEVWIDSDENYSFPRNSNCFVGASVSDYQLCTDSSSQIKSIEFDTISSSGRKIRWQTITFS